MPTRRGAFDVVAGYHVAVDDTDSLLLWHAGRELGGDLCDFLGGRQPVEPRHPLLNFPNKITQKDFGNWVQERGLYFPSDWDPRYTAILATSDQGEPPLKGGLLVAPYGRGNYIYTSMVWYRQLRAGLPGGYRFFSNLISYGRRKED